MSVDDMGQGGNVTHSNSLCKNRTVNLASPTPVPNTGAAQRLSAVALRLFNEHGYDNVTTSHIAEAAGVSQRTFFRHFPKKSDVLRARAEQATDAFFELLCNKPRHMSVVQALVATIQEHSATVQSTQESQAMFRLVRQSPSLQGFVSEYRRSYEQRLVAWIGAHTGRNPADLDIVVAGAMLAAARIAVLERISDLDVQTPGPEHTMPLIQESLKAIDVLQS